jgi:opacity protein-like surface antigen
MKNIILTAFVFVPFLLSAQDKSTNMSTYFTPFAGITFQGELNTEQTGTAHKLGHFNNYDTDFDLQVSVKGTGKSTVGFTYGLTYGSVWKKEGRKLNPGFEIDVFHTSASHASVMSNPLNEEVTGIVGANGDSVVDFVDEHYKAGHHTFSNTMTRNSWNAAANFTLSYDISSNISVNGAIGVGFAAITLKEAESLQVSPAPANAEYETTNENGGGPVNHFNSQPNASNNLMISQFRLGTKFQLTQKVALKIDARGIYQESGNFTFGSTQYTDHAPTDNWTYRIDGGVSFMLTAGVCISL